MNTTVISHAVKYLRGAKQILKAKWLCRFPAHKDILFFDFRLGHPINKILADITSAYSTAPIPNIQESVCIPIAFIALFAKGKLLHTYYRKYIELAQPKWVITYIDNSAIFYSLGLQKGGPKTIFLQNGLRAYYSDVFEILDKQSTMGMKYRVDFMLVFGKHIGELYSRYIDGEVIPIGSVRNNATKITMPKMAKTLSYISDYRDVAGVQMGGRYLSFRQFWQEPDGLVVRFLVDYAKRNGLDFAVIPVCKPGHSKVLQKKEREYFNKLVGEEVGFLDFPGQNGSYDAVDFSGVVVTTDSTMGLEAIARGTRAAIFSIRSSMLLEGLNEPDSRNFGWPSSYPEEGTFWTNKASVSSFTKIIDYLFSVSIEQWKRDLEDQDFWSLMQYDPGNQRLKALCAFEPD